MSPVCGDGERYRQWGSLLDDSLPKVPGQLPRLTVPQPPPRSQQHTPAHRRYITQTGLAFPLPLSLFIGLCFLSYFTHYQVQTAPPVVTGWLPRTSQRVTAAAAASNTPAHPPLPLPPPPPPLHPSTTLSPIPPIPPRASRTVPTAPRKPGEKPWQLVLQLIRVDLESVLWCKLSMPRISFPHLISLTLTFGIQLSGYQLDNSGIPNLAASLLTCKSKSNTLSALTWKTWY